MSEINKLMDKAEASGLQVKRNAIVIEEMKAVGILVRKQGEKEFSIMYLNDEKTTKTNS